MDLKMIELCEEDLRMVAGGAMSQYEADLAEWMSHGGFGVIGAKGSSKGGKGGGKPPVENMGLLKLLKKYGTDLGADKTNPRDAFDGAAPTPKKKP